MEENAPITGAKEAAGAPAGELRLHEFPSRIFRNTRMLRVWLPAGYSQLENQGRHYPVFYLNDGQNLFDPATAYIGVDWQVDEAADRLIGEGKVPPLIVVGIDNAQKDRFKEYLPYRSLHPPILRPQGKRYPDFLLNEVMPFLYQRYRIARGPENTGLGGSSLGAVISLFTVMDRPGIFGRLLLESPSLFISNRQLLRCARAFRQWPDKVFMAIGSREAGSESRDRQTVQDVRDLEHVLRHAGLGNDRLLVKVAEGATHSEQEWARRFPQALEFLFGSLRTSG
ncbi:MAG: alpha/beta hydrolase [Terriglobales bacterium]